jgi:Zn-dependent protease with chaperone function
MTEEALEAEKKQLAKEYKQLLKISYRTLSVADKKLIRSAFEVAVDAHKDQRRKSGEAYIFHPVAVAKIVASEIGLDATSIAAALLHDVVEDTDYTLADLEQDEIIAVLAHEVGHYKRNHIVFNLLASIATTGLTLWLLSLFVGSPLLTEALGVSIPSFHVGLIAFGILYSPISEVTGLLMNYLSRKFEYQADNYAKDTYSAPPLISALKKLSKNSLSNLTPHPAYVVAHYSHPTLLQRFKNLME